MMKPRKDYNIYIGTTTNKNVEIIRWFEDKNIRTIIDKVVCICPICGEEFVSALNDVLRNDKRQVRGCKNCANKKTGELHHKHYFDIGDLLHNNLTVEDIFYKNQKQYATVRCSCGNVFTTSSQLLTKKNRPSTMCEECYNRKKGNERMKKFEIEPGTIYGYAEVLYPGEPKQTNNPRHLKSTSVCKCLLCGKIFTVNNSNLIKGGTKSCGCLHSILESLTADELDKYETVIYIHDKPWDKTLRSKSKGGLLKFDFTLLRENKKAPTTLDVVACIECQGLQHYIDGDFGRPQREETDEIKKEYCKAHDIPFYEIRYDEKDIVEQRVREILTELNLI